MRAIDTNVVVRLVARDDPRQTVSAENFVRGGAWVSVLALAEPTWVLGPEVATAALELFRIRPSLKFSDWAK